MESEIRDNNIKNAISKLDEILHFKIDEEISGRLQNARFRLKNEDTQTTLRLLERVIKILERFIHEETTTKLPISNRDIFEWLKRILNDLENFRVHEASKKLEDLQNYFLPPDIQKFCETLQAHLEEYDDGAAEEELRKKLSTMMVHPN